jgi:amino acid transporter
MDPHRCACWTRFRYALGPGSRFVYGASSRALAALVTKYPGLGGLDLWTRRDFGAWPGFLCFWVYWIGIAFLFPTAALLYIRVGFSIFGPLFAHLGDNRFYLLGATVAMI